MSTAFVTDSYVIGGAVLALWLSHRYVSAPPRTLRGAFALAGIAVCVVSAAGQTTAAAQAVAGPAAALLVVYLPSLVFAFWAAARLLRVYAETLGRFIR
jgi:hypothetical protein